MAEECVVGVYKSLEDAKEAVHALVEAEFPKKKISMAASAVDQEKELREALQAGDQAEKDAAIGAGVGGTLGLLAGATLLTIPGVGLVFIAGPIAAGLTGAVVGALLGALSGWGVHKDHIAKYEKKIHKGRLLVIAHGRPDEVASAERVLMGTRTEELHLHAANSADSPEIDD